MRLRTSKRCASCATVAAPASSSTRAAHCRNAAATRGGFRAATVALAMGRAPLKPPRTTSRCRCSDARTRAQRHVAEASGARHRCATDCRSRRSRGTRDARRCVAVVARVTTLLSLRSGQFAAARGEPIDFFHYVQVTIRFVASERECTTGGSLPQGDRRSRSSRSCFGFRFQTATRFGIAPCCMRPIAPQCFRVSGHRPDERTPLRAVVSCAARIAIADRVRRAPVRANPTL